MQLNPSAIPIGFLEGFLKNRDANSFPDQKNLKKNTITASSSNFSRQNLVEEADGTGIPLTSYRNCGWNFDCTIFFSACFKEKMPSCLYSLWITKKKKKSWPYFLHLIFCTTYFWPNCFRIANQPMFLKLK